MKIKFIFFASLLSFLSSVVNAQWVTNTNTNGIHYTGGNVGIGTSSPESTLHVLGTSRFYLDNQSHFIMTSWGLASSDNITLDAENSSGTAHVPLSFAASLFYFYNGNVGIGTNDTKGYKLAVAGSMVAEAVTVKLKSNWPDYVFNKNHKLMPLNEVENFIKANNHLPNIPTEAEVKTNGINVAEMNVKLLQKVEELTLYVIEQQKQIEELKRK